MKLPFVNSFATLRDHLGNFIVPQLDAAGRFRVAVTSSVAPSVGGTPPASPSDGDLWFNTSAGWRLLMAYDASRSMWLSTSDFLFQFGADSTDNAALRSSGVNTPGSNSGILVPLDACIVRLSAHARGGQSNKGFTVRSDGSSGSALIGSFALSSYEYKGNALAWNLSEDDLLWVRSDGAGSASRDVAVSIWARWRVTS